MPFFGRRKKEEDSRLPAELPSLSSLDQIQMLPPSMEPSKPVVKETEKPTVAPLFVKIDRYRQILNTIATLKTSLIVVKNSMATLDQIENAREQTIGIVNDLVGKMNDTLMNLDNELLRPAGFHETTDISMEHNDVRTIEASVADLQSQIQQLKSELSKMV